MTADHVMDQFGDEYRFTDPGAAEESGLAAPFQGREDVDGLDSRFKDF